ncbi:ABC transporter permease [Catenulispora sp. NF23]|uniref:ABC transporter permease n=1 Tax=Catenulispora pinistramenti TaxID=2705254 RepID=A0ABS5KS97_9ACTN|nr:ABC transporter permease [Catenulispora pinistramenti]MBS2533364.1 ABC transporter permease [Catenulispora pinistramenti]MBS2548889.1 ABC transporter permease [Catenulispora pinistramenti]
MSITASALPDTAAVPPAPEGGAAARRGPVIPLRYVVGRLVGAAVSMLAVVFTGFFLFRVVPGDPVRSLTRGRAMTNAQLATLRHQFGIDKPLISQFGDYTSRIVRGDLGTSYQYKTSVSSLIGSHVWATVYLVGTATLISAFLGLRIGVRSAWRNGSRSDRANTGIALVLWSMPTFWLALIMIMVFSVGFGPIPGMFPTGGMSSPNVHGLFPVIWDHFRHLVLPCLTLVAVLYAQYLLTMRATLLEEVGSDYLTTARAKGLREDDVRRKHAVPNSMLPAVTLVFLNLGTAVSGSILAETIFSWPGLGSLFYEALTVPDQPLLEGLFIFFSAAVIVMNLLAELLYPILDPRVRTS